jgi:hypothetical protein
LTNLSRKLDASLGYLQLQIGTPHNPFTMDYSKWGYLAPLSWVKMLWKSLHHFEITLHISFPDIALPREQDKAMMEIIMSQDLDPEEIKRINRCRVFLKAIFLLDITTAYRKYLEHFVFEPGLTKSCSQYRFPREKPTRQDWEQWDYFWHSFTTTGGKLEMPLGGWTNPTHRIWTWYYHKGRDKLYNINGTSITYYKQDSGWRRTRATSIFLKAQEECNVLELPLGIPTSVIEISATTVTKLQEGPRSPKLTKTSQMFWEFISTWGGTWMWEGIGAGTHSKDDLT